MNTTSINNNPSVTTTLAADKSGQTLSLNEGYFAKRNVLDWIFAALVVLGGVYAFAKYSAFMDVYEKGILFATVPAAIAMGWFWRPLRVLMVTVVGFALLGIASYQVDGTGNLARADQVFWLKYFLSSQSAILWMSVLFFMSTIFYWIGMVFSRETSRQSDAFESLGSKNRLGCRWHGPYRHTRTLVRKLPDWRRRWSHPSQQPVRSVCVVMLDDRHYLPVL